VLEECVGCQNEYCCCIILPNHMLLAPLWNSWVLNTGIFFPVLPVILNCYCQTSTCFPKERSIFEAYFSKLMKTSKWRSSDGCICRMLHFTIKALTLWSTTVICISTDMAAVVLKWTACVPISDPCVIYCNVFIIQIEKNLLFDFFSYIAWAADSIIR
jgi:hypothetical protein